MFARFRRKRMNPVLRDLLQETQVSVNDFIYPLFAKNGKGIKDEVASMPNGNWGQPVWDKFPTSNNDIQAFKTASGTYLGRLVPFSRLILLDKENVKPF